MRRLLLFILFLALPLTACSFEFQTLPAAGELPRTPGVSPAPTTDVSGSGNGRVLAGPDIDYNGIRFTLDPALGSQLYVFDEEITLEGLTAHYTRFALTQEKYCQTWCVQVYPVAEFEQAFGSFVFPPAGYRGGAATVFEAQKKALAFQNGSGDRALEAFGQSHFGVSNESLRYVFRGYTADRQYGVYVEIAARAATLPDVAPTPAADVQELLDYNQQAAEAMNTLSPADFTPNLDLLDALVSSIQVGTP